MNIATNEFSYPAHTSFCNETPLRPGDRLQARYWWGDHIGTVDWSLNIWSSSFKAGRTALVSYETFSGGRKVLNMGNYGNPDPHLTLSSYVAMNGRQYCLFTSNCEQVDNLARGKTKRIGQIELLCLALAGITLGLVFYKK